MLVIADYGVGNLFSLVSSLRFIGEKAEISGDPEVLQNADRIILPGVGAFADAAKKLRDSGLDTVIYKKVQSGTPLLGICLGMQLLFDSSEEYGSHKGLGLIKGKVKPISDVIPPTLKIPHIGWDSLNFTGEKHPVFKYVENGEFVYFVHSYYAAECDSSVVATCDYGAELTAAAASGNVCGCQFHPEKSGETGLNILRGFCCWEGSLT